MSDPYNRSVFLASLGSLGALAACSSGKSPAGLPVLAAVRPLSAGATLTIDTTLTDLPVGTNIYAYIIGAIPSGAYRLDSGGTPRAIGTADNMYGNTLATFPPSMQGLNAAQVSAIASTYPSKSSGGWADYSIAIPVGSKTVIPLSGILSLGVGTGTAAFSGRIYLSAGVPVVPFSPLSAMKYTQPSVGQNEQGALTLFDWIEFSFDSGGNFNGNTTQVDQFGFPLTLAGTPVSGSPPPVQGQLNTGRPAIMSAISGLPAPFGGSAFTVPVPPGAGGAFPVSDYLRAVSPKTVAAQNCYLGPLSSYFYGTIASWYKTWQSTPLVTNDQSTGYYTGYVPASGSFAGMLTFYQGNLALSALQSSYAGGQTPAFVLTGPTNDIITSTDVFECASSLASGSSAAKNVEKMIAAAFNRGVMSSVLDDTTCSTASSSFYKTGAFNLWSKKFHDFNTNGFAYGFPYDDVCSQNPSIGLQAANITIGLGKFLS